MNSQHMLVFENTRADFTLERLDVTNAVNCRQVSSHGELDSESFAADVTLVLPDSSSITVHVIVVSADC